MPKVITYSKESPTFLKMTESGDEYFEGTPKAEKFKTAESGEGGKWFRRGVDVRWVKGGFLEIGVASFDPSREQPSDGVYITLDREAANRIIRALRDGRDGALGKDA